MYDSLPRLDVPTPIVQGCEDVVTDPRNAEILAQRVKNARLARFDGTGHGLPFQDPRRFLSAIVPFLSERS